MALHLHRMKAVHLEGVFIHLAFTQEERM